MFLWGIEFMQGSGFKRSAINNKASAAKICTNSQNKHTHFITKLAMQQHNCRNNLKPSSQNTFCSAISIFLNLKVLT
jgi:hypothetical protein